MVTHYRKDGRSKWKKIDDDVNLEEFGLKKLYEMEGRDSDNGYHEYIEFDRDGVRTYIAGAYESPYESNDWHPSLDSYVYGTEDEVNKFLESESYGGKVERYEFSPNRDFIRLDLNAHIKNWPREI